eukprot:5237139-Amphidinium_carterae.2
MGITRDAFQSRAPAWTCLFALTLSIMLRSVSDAYTRNSPHYSETFLASVLADSRVAIHAHALQQDVIDEVHYLEGLDPFVWSLLSSILPMDDTRFRHEVLKASMAGLGYLQERVFKVTSVFVMVALQTT